MRMHANVTRMLEVQFADEHGVMMWHVCDDVACDDLTHVMMMWHVCDDVTCVFADEHGKHWQK